MNSDQKRVLPRFVSLFFALTLGATNARAIPLKDCLKPIVQSVLTKNDSRRGVSKELFSEVITSTSTQAYLKEHQNLDSFPMTNFQYLSLLTPAEIAGLGRPDLTALAAKNKRKLKFGFIAFNPLRELNNTYYHGHMQISDAVNNHAKKRILEHINRELATHPDLKPYLIALYDDYKGIGFAFEDPKSAAVSARLDALLDRAVRNASYQFSAEYQQSDLAILTRGQRSAIADPSRWISGGIGQSHDQAAVAARYARDLVSTNASIHFRDIEKTVAKDLQELQKNAAQLTALLGEDSPLVDPSRPGLLSLEAFQIMRSIKTLDVEAAAGENLREALKFSFPTVTLTDAQLGEIRSVLGLLPGDRARARVSDALRQPELIRAKLIVENGDTGTFSISPDALVILQEEREFKHYFAAVNKVIAQRSGKPLSEPLVKDIRAVVNQVDRFTVPVLQESRNPIAYEAGLAGFIAADFSGLGARNLYETQRALLNAESPQSAVLEARRAFNLADRPLIQMRERFDLAVRKNTKLPVTPKAFSGDEMSVPLHDASAIPSRAVKFKILRALSQGALYSPSDVRLSFGLHFKKAQDLEKRVRARLMVYPELRSWLAQTTFAVDVMTDARGLSTLHLMPSRRIPRGLKDVVKKEFLESFAPTDPFSAGKVIVPTESKPQASLQLDNDTPLRNPSSRPEPIRLEVA